MNIFMHLIYFLSTAVESYLSQGKDGELGVTGEGSLLDNAQGKNFDSHFCQSAIRDNRFLWVIYYENLKSCTTVET